jgi:hypothetical protein
MHHGLILELKNGPDLSVYGLDHDMQTVEIGDSLVKVTGQNFCTVYKSDGRVIKLKFIYDD